MKEFMKTKEELLEEVIRLNEYMEIVVLTRLPAIDVLNALLRLQTVFYGVIG